MSLMQDRAAARGAADAQLGAEEPVRGVWTERGSELRLSPTRGGAQALLPRPRHADLHCVSVLGQTHRPQDGTSGRSGRLGQS